MKKYFFLYLFFVFAVFGYGQIVEQFHIIIGSDVNSTEIQEVLNTFDTNFEIITYRDCYFYSFRNEGVSFRFDNDILTAVFIYGPRAPRPERQFAGILPLNLEITFSRNEIENVLGIANEESTYALEYIIPQWDNKKIRFLFSGSSKNSLIDYMCIHK